MNRIELIQEIFRKTNFTTYLEIGCQSGVSFLPIRCKYKIAIDPHFLIKKTKKIMWLISNPYNIRNKYFEETSDEFFQNRESMLNKMRKEDVVLVDGLHTFQASLNDVLNSLKHLNNNGIIFLHDCLPPHKMAAMPRKESSNEGENIDAWTGEWCGDVWKSIVYLRRKLPDLLDVSVLNIDYGLGVVRTKNIVDRDLKIDKNLFDKIDKIKYEEMIENVESMLNLKSVGHVRKIVEEIVAHSKK